MHIAVFHFMGTDKGSSGNAAKAHHHTGVLNHFIRIQKPCTADAHFLLLHKLEHFLQGIRL